MNYSAQGTSNSGKPVKIVTAREIAKLKRTIVNGSHDFNLEPLWRDKSVALHLAVESQNAEIMTILLEKGADPNTVNEKGNNCLHLACRLNSFRIIHHLVPLTDVNAQNNKNLTALHIAVIRNRYSVAKLLIYNGADVNALSTNGLRALHLAVDYKHERLMRLLLEHGADPNLPDIKQITPFYQCFYVYQHGISDNVIDMFLRHGASLHVKDQFGHNALHLAALYGTNRFLWKLLQIMDLNDKTEAGWMAFQCAIYPHPHCRSSVVTLLSRLKTELVLKRIAVLTSQQRQVDVLNAECFLSHDWIITEYTVYQRELNVMKETMVAEGSSDVTYYDLLMKRNNALVSCLRSSAVIEAMTSEEYKTKFYNYALDLEANFTSGLERMQKMDKFRAILKNIFGDLFKDNIIERISTFYNDKDFAICIAEL